MHISWARLASFYHFGFISDPLIVSKFHNKTHDPKGQENKIYTIVNGRETFYRRHTVPVTSCSEVKYVLKRASFGSKDCTRELKLECAYFLDQTSYEKTKVCWNAISQLATTKHIYVIIIYAEPIKGNPCISPRTWWCNLVGMAADSESIDTP